MALNQVLEEFCFQSQWSVLLYIAVSLIKKKKAKQNHNPALEMCMALTWVKDNTRYLWTMSDVDVDSADGTFQSGLMLFLVFLEYHLDSNVNVQSNLLLRQPSYRPSSIYKRWYCQSPFISQIFEKHTPFSRVKSDINGS